MPRIGSKGGGPPAGGVHTSTCVELGVGAPALDALVVVVLLGGAIASPHNPWASPLAEENEPSQAEATAAARSTLPGCAIFKHRTGQAAHGDESSQTLPVSAISCSPNEKSPNLFSVPPFSLAV